MSFHSDYQFTSDLHPATLLADGDVIVAGAPARGKTASIAVPTMRDWVGPCVLLSHGGLYPETLESTQGRSAARVVRIEDSPIAAATLRIADPAAPVVDLFADGNSLLVLTASMESMSRLVLTPHGARATANVLVRGVVDAMKKWVVDASIETLLRPSSARPRPLLILDDYWTQATPFIPELLEALQGPDAHAVRLMYIMLDPDLVRERIGKLTFDAMLKRTAHRIQFEYYRARSSYEAGQPPLTDWFSGVDPRHGKQLDSFEAYVRSGERIVGTRFTPYFESSQASGE